MEFSLALAGRIVLQPGLLTLDRCGTAGIARQARKSARRDVSPSGKRFDAACRAIAAAHRVAHGTGRPRRRRP